MSAALVGLVLFWKPAVRGDEAQDRQRAASLLERLNEANSERWKHPEGFRQALGVFLEDFVDTLSDEEIRFLGRVRPESDLNEAVFRKWAMADHESAMKAIREEEEARASRIRLAGTGTEGGPGEAELAGVFVMYLGAVDGWAASDPKTVWDALTMRKGPFAKSPAIEEYRSTFLKAVFRRLAAADPRVAEEELIAFLGTRTSAGVDELEKTQVLGGYLRGVPKGQDWAGLLGQLLDYEWVHFWLNHLIRSALLGRWLEDDPAAAERWFREGDLEGVHWSWEFGDSGSSATPSGSDRGPNGAIRRRCDLGEAAGYWAGRDFPTAWTWMKSCKDLDLEGFDRSVFRGIMASLGEDPSGDTAIPQTYLLRQIGALPDQADRDRAALRFAKVLWEFRSGNFLVEPQPSEEDWLGGIRSGLASLGISPETAGTIIDKLRNQSGQD